MRAHKLLSLFGALTLTGGAATLVLHGGWQAAAAAFAALGVVGFALTFAVIGAETEPPRIA
jgi:hypothetical protein